MYLAGISLAIPQYVSSTLDSLTIKCSIPDVTDITYTIQIWSNTTDKWYDTKCRRRSNVVGSCVVKVPKAIITLTGLSPGHIYYLRLVSPYLVYSQVSESMATKKLGKVSFDFQLRKCGEKTLQVVLFHSIQPQLFVIWYSHISKNTQHH